MAFDDNKRELSLGELENANTDRTVNPATMVRGMMGKNGSNWVYISADSNGNLVTNSTATVTTAPLSADSSSISAKQNDAGLLHVSGFSPDAGTFRVSAIGGTAGDRTLVDGTTQTISATLTPISAKPAASTAGLVVNTFQFDAGQQLVSSKQGDAGLLRISSIMGDAGLQHVSAFVDSGSISAKNQDANFMHVSGFSPDAALFRISAINSISSLSPDAGLFRTSAIQADAGLQHVSAFVDSGSVSAKSGDANQLHISAVQGDAGLLHISSIVGDANNQHVSAVQGDAGLQHVSAYLGVDTTGTLTTFQTLSVSASQSVKGSAGTLYGYYLYNTDTKPNYVKFFNVSAAANIGTDTPLLTICLPASAAANVEFPHGIKGFTAGINITATSGRPLDNTALPAASSVGAVLFYN